MKKNLIALAVAATMAAPLAAQAGDIETEVSGFIDVIYTNTKDVSAFGADGEVDFQATKGDVTVRVDADLRLDGTSGQLEQAFFAWKAMDALTVIGGVFNNPIGQEAEDAPDMEFTSHSVVYNILNNQTALNGNNIAGVAAAGGNKMFTGTLAVVNNIGAQQGNGAVSTADKLSIAAILNANLMENLDLELGYVTQDEQAAVGGALDGVAQAAGNVLDFNAQYGIAGFTLGLDFLMADKIVDNSYNIWGGFAINDKAAVKARYEAVSLAADGADTVTKYTIYGTYSINDNLSTALEYNQGDLGNNGAGISGLTGIVDDSVVTLEFIGTF